MQRVFSFILVIALVFLASRVLVRALPGDPAENILAETGSRISLSELRSELGLDRPFWSATLHDARRFAAGDFGKSISNGERVADLLETRAWVTLKLAFMTLIFGLSLSLVLGLLAAHSCENPRFIWADRACSHLGVWMSALPTPWLGPVLMYLLAVQIPLFPIASGERNEWSDLLLPSLTLALVFSGLWCRLIRERVKESLFLGSARGARARGLSEVRVLFKYGMIPVSGPLLAYLGSQAGTLLGGALVTETIFNLRGLGTLLVESVHAREYPVFEAAAFWVAFTSLLGTYAGDWANARLTRAE